MRYYPKGFIFDVAGCCVFIDKKEYQNFLLAYLNSNVSKKLMQAFSPTLNYEAGSVSLLPVPKDIKSFDDQYAKECLKIVQHDWDFFERSSSFRNNFFVHNSFDLGKVNLQAIYEVYKQNSVEEIEKLRKYELENEKEVYKALDIGYEPYELNDKRISLSINPVYRYGEKIELKTLNNRLQEDTFCELISYGFGCMMGRYSLNQEGLVYAHSGNEGFKELVAEGAYQLFPADDDGIVPLASENWLFSDDATARFREFVKTVWGDEHLQENLEFVAESLCLHALKPLSGSKGQGESANETVRRYFSKQFYKDHCKTYKKRPIYWLFSSGKEKAFECLVYLHRYNEGTLSRMRTEYVTPLMGKYEAQHSLLAEQKIEAGSVGSSTEERRFEKELKSLEKKQAELRTFDEQLKHYAEMRITLDLDDGVKANYGKFGNLLADVKTIHGKAVK